MGTPIVENPNCQLCDLHAYAGKRSRCLKGRSGDNAYGKLVIFLDHPSVVDDKRGKGVVSENANYLTWLMSRMSITPDQYHVDYVLKCYPGKCQSIRKKAQRMEMVEQCSIYRIATLQRLQPSAIVAMGAKACEAFIGADKVGNFEGTTWIPTEPAVREFVSHVWIAYSPGYGLEDASETVSIFRTLWAAALDANLKPKMNLELKMYDYGT